MLYIASVLVTTLLCYADSVPDVFPNLISTLQTGNVTTVKGKDGKDITCDPAHPAVEVHIVHTQKEVPGVGVMVMDGYLQINEEIKDITVLNKIRQFRFELFKMTDNGWELDREPEYHDFCPKLNKPTNTFATVAITAKPPVVCPIPPLPSLCATDGGIISRFDCTFTCEATSGVRDVCLYSRGRYYFTDYTIWTEDLPANVDWSNATRKAVNYPIANGKCFTSLYLMYDVFGPEETKVIRKYLVRPGSKSQ